MTVCHRAALCLLALVLLPLHASAATIPCSSPTPFRSATDALTRAYARIYPTPTTSGWSGPAVLSGSSTSTATTTDITAALANGQYQIGVNLFQQEGDPGQVTFYRDPTFQISYGMSWDQARRMTRRRDRVGTTISSTTVLPSGYGQYDEVQPGYSTSSSGPILSSISSTLSSVSETSSYSQNADYDDTSTSGWGYRLPWVSENITRDAAGRITQHTRQFIAGNGGYGTDAVPMVGTSFSAPVSSFAYSSSNGRMTTFTNADGVHTITYDSRGLVSTVAISTGSEGTYTFGYDVDGRSSSLSYPGGLSRTQGYDNEGRLNSRCYKYTALPDRCYAITSFDNAGNPLVMTDPEGTYTFVYDALNRLTKSTRSVSGQPDEVETYNYNSLGGLSGMPGASSFSDQRPLLAGGGNADSAVPSSYNGVSITLDSGGRITSDQNSNTLLYDRRGRLVSVTQPASGGNTYAEFYSYDSRMRRTGRFGVLNGTAISNNQEFLVWDGADLVASVDGLGGTNFSWFYEGVDQPLRVKYSSTPYYYEIDLAGNVRRLRGTDGSDQGGYRYQAFGAEYAHDCSLPATSGCQAPTPSFTQPLRWKARQWSDFAQMYDVRARWWNPQLGVFASIDELSFQSARDTLWSWPGQSPMRFSDPTGHDATETNPIQSLLTNGWLPPALANFGFAVRARNQTILAVGNPDTAQSALASLPCANAAVAGAANLVGVEASIIMGIVNLGVGAARSGIPSLSATTSETTAEGPANFLIFHGTDVDSANDIVANGINQDIAAMYGGGDSFWATDLMEAAENWASTNPADGMPAVVGFELTPAQLNTLTQNGLIITGNTYEFTGDAWGLLNQFAQRFHIP